ncbi:hypothetical protein, partial [Thiolapillus sp.]
RTGPQTALAKLAAGWLQRRFAALLQTGTRRLNTTYIVAGLIIAPWSGFMELGMRFFLWLTNALGAQRYEP